MLLPDEILEFFGAHALGQWTLGVTFGTRGVGRRGIKQAHWVPLTIPIALCRRASYNKIPAATAAFSDSTPEVGIRSPVARAPSTGLTPCPSLPMIIPQGAARPASLANFRARGVAAYHAISGCRKISSASTE